MVKALPIILAFALSFIPSSTSALPSLLVLNRTTVPAQGNPDGRPYTLLGRPYQTRSRTQPEGQGCQSSSSQWTQTFDASVANQARRDNADFVSSSIANASTASAGPAEIQMRTRIWNSDQSQTMTRAERRAKLPLPLLVVLDALPGSGLGPARSRIARRNRRTQPNPCLDGMPLPDHAWPRNETDQGDVPEQPVPPHDAPGYTKRETGSRRVEPYTRLSAIGNWKSRYL